MTRALQLVAILIPLIAAAVVAGAWYGSRRASQQLDAVITAQNIAIDQARARERQRDSDLATAVAAIAAQKRAVQTPREAANALPAALSMLPFPVTVNLPAISRPTAPAIPSGAAANAAMSTESQHAPQASSSAAMRGGPSANESRATFDVEPSRTIANTPLESAKQLRHAPDEFMPPTNETPGSGSLPGATGAETTGTEKTTDAKTTGVGPISVCATDVKVTDVGAKGAESNNDNLATISLPPADLKPLYDTLQECRVCALQKTAAQKSLADAQTQISALIRERDAAIQSAHRGNLWRRLKDEAKWIAIGAAVGTGASKAMRF